MKKILFALTLLLTLGVSAQLTSSGHNNVMQTSYTNGRPNDNIYVYCGTQLSQANGSLTATPPSGTGPFTFVWSYYNESNNSWAVLAQETGMTSTRSNLPSDGYQVMIRDANNVVVGCYVAWVWNLNVAVNPTNNALTCNSTNLTTGASVENTFNYYNIPPGQSLITENTEITVCFSANHTYVSDLGFFLRAPNGAVISLSPNPGAIGQNNVCNSGNNVSNLCFSTSATANLNVCTASVPLTGTYGSYGPSATPINWAPLIGQNAAQGGWAVQIYDCIGSDVGALTNATLSFTNLDISASCEAEANITYSSGNINSAINDNSCTAASASIFIVPLPLNLTTPITLTANVSGTWTASNTIPGWNGTTSNMGNGTVTDIPAGQTEFVYTVTATINGVSCSNSGLTIFENTCCTAVANITPTTLTICPEQTQAIAATAEGTYVRWRPSTGISDSTTASTNVTVVNNSHDMLEQYFYLHAFDTPNECERIDSVFVRVHGKPFVEVDSISCSPTYQIAGTIATNPGSWVVTSGTYTQTYTTLNPNIIMPNPGVYTLTYTDGCGNSETRIIRRVAVPQLPADTTICATSLTFPNVDMNGVSGQWTVDQGLLTVDQNTVTFIGSNDQTTNYTIRLTESSCDFFDTRIIKIVGKPTVSGPNFSCMPVEHDLVATSYAGGEWSLAGTIPAGLNTDSFLFLYPIDGNLMAIRAGVHGTYKMKFTDHECGHEAMVDVVFKPYVWTEVQDTVICLGSSQTLQAWIPPYEANFIWSTGSTESAIEVSTVGVYHVKVYNECYEFVDSAVVGYKVCDIEAPNVIYIGSSIGNNQWYVQQEGIMDFECVIVDRWGNVVYEFDQVTGFWDGKGKNGKDVSEGVYFYKIIAQTEGKQEVFKQGFITVIH